ncbi:MAG: penicillin acylase family protein [Rhodospirillales bacterium]
MKRLLTVTVLGLLAIVVAIGGTGALWLWSTLPKTDGIIEVPVIENPVEVLRDANGIPHIFAKSARDVYFALGYVHAQDRFWQMEMMRRLGAGRLAEVLGPGALASDKWMRTLGLYKLAEKQAAALSAPARLALNRYAAGVNARIERGKRLPWSVPAIEFALLRYAPEPWKPADSLVWGKIMATRLGGNWRDEVLRARLARKLKPTQVGELWPVYPADAPATVEKVAALTRGMDLERLAAASPRPPGLPRGASNAWAVDSKNTMTRGAILANDPHLGFSAPILWYLARIDAPDLTIAGATVPGVPFTILGHNGRIAWGITDTQSDIEDLFVEQTRADGREYLTPQGWKEFERAEETIAVKGGSPVTFTVRRSRHGPVISDVSDASAKAAGKGAVMALSATYLEPEDRTPEALFKLARTDSWDSFVNVLRDFHAPQTNFFYADTQGNIGFIAPGKVPVRKRGWGLVPSPGWDGGTDWQGFLPFDLLPSVYNPPSGHIVNANNRITPEGYTHFITTDWAPAYRARRILGLLEDKEMSVHATTRIQLDYVSEMARQLLPLMLDIEPTDPKSRKAHSMLAEWNGAMSRTRPEPLIFSTWLLELNRAVYADELGDRTGDYLSLRPRFIISVLTRRQAWCDNVETPETEDCHERIRLALKRAIERLEAAMGGDMDGWQWGDVHRAHFSHRALGALPWLARFVDLEIPTDGGNYTVNRGGSRVSHPQHPFQHIHGAGVRSIYDLADLRRSRFVLATGQSGNPVSSHYRDLMADWRDGRYHRMSQSRSALRNAAAGNLTLSPLIRNR